MNPSKPIFMNFLVPKVLYEDNHIIGVYKPFTMPSQSDITGAEDLLSWTKNYIKQKYHKKGNVYLALVHRLDRPVGGVMVFAKTSKAAKRLSQLFQEKKVEKIYYAVIYGSPKEPYGKIESLIYKDSKKNISMVVKKGGKKAKKAITYYEVISTISHNNKTYSLIKLKPETGRSHQLRVHCKTFLGPIVGDIKYGKKIPLKYGGIALLSQKISFTHVVKREPLVIQLNKFPNMFPWSLFKNHKLF